MIMLTKGANIALADLSAEVGTVHLSLAWSDPDGQADADVSVLLLGADGKVRGDGDFVFYNQPATDDGAVRLAGKVANDGEMRDQISVALEALPAEVHRVVAAASMEAAEGVGFGGLSGVHLTLADRTGEDLLRFDIADAAGERAFLFGELYRRDGAWKFRAVGQGYDEGLAGLAADFGIDVEEPAPAGETVPPAPEPVPEPAPEPAARPVRTQKVRKVVVPPVTERALADHDSWRSARLFPTGGIGSSTEQEVRATSSLLAVMAQVKDFGRQLTRRFGAPVGLFESYTEVEFRNGDTRLRPDGVIRVARAGKVWTALVEVKTAGNALKRDQVEAYLDLAAKEGFQAVITVSNDLALTGAHPVTVDRRKLRRVSLCHLSWAEIQHEADMLRLHSGVPDATQAWVLSELVEYLRHPRSGCGGLETMGPGWVTLREAVRAGTLRPGDRVATQVAECWDKLVQQLRFRLTVEIGVPVTLATPRRLLADPAARIAATVESLVAAGTLATTYRIPGTVGPLTLTADLRTGQVLTSATLDAPDHSRTLTRVKWLLRQLTEAPAGLRVEAVVPGRELGACELLGDLRKYPARLVLKPGERITAFVLTGSARLGARRGSRGSTDAADFIHSVDRAVDAFYWQVVQGLRPLTAEDPQLVEAASA